MLIHLWLKRVAFIVRQLYFIYAVNSSCITLVDDITIMVHLVSFTFVVSISVIRDHNLFVSCLVETYLLVL